MKRNVKTLLKQGMRRIFELGQRAGVDILPRHYYSEIPDLRSLKKSEQWKQPLSMIGVTGIEISSQMAFVKECCPSELVDTIHAASIHGRACAANGAEGYGSTEADFLFCFVASKRPKQIFQIGCGVSTAVCLMAAEHAGYAPELICVEPYPTRYLKKLSREGRIKLIEEKAQCLSLASIEELGGDLLFFVDSSHTLGPAGEVSRIILEMLPRLKPGTTIHFHDITFPYDYNRHVMTSALFFQHESVLLHAYLVNNSTTRLLASLAMLHYACPQTLKDYLPNYSPAPNSDGLNVGPGHFPSAAYLKVEG